MKKFLIALTLMSSVLLLTSCACDGGCDAGTTYMSSCPSCGTSCCDSYAW